MKDYKEIDWSKDRVIVIDFRSETCGPCKQLLKNINSIDCDAINADFYECCVDDDDDAMDTYAIRTVPTLVFIKNGTVEGRLTGLQTKEQILAEIERIKNK